MMIQSINALTSVSNTTTIKNPQPQKPSFEGLGVNKTAKTMKALAAAAILGMAAVGMSSCVQPTDPTPFEIPEEKKPEETTPIDEEETNPIEGEEETKPIEETPFIVNDTISPALAATDEYKLLREVGFSHIAGEDVPVEAGKY